LPWRTAGGARRAGLRRRSALRADSAALLTEGRPAELATRAMRALLEHAAGSQRTSALRARPSAALLAAAEGPRAGHRPP
jgi:hypothetical protein